MSNPKVVILTGASRGIGLAIAKYLLEDGHKLVLVARTAQPLEKLKKEYVGAVEVFTGDLKDFEVRFEAGVFQFKCFPWLVYWQHFSPKLRWSSDVETSPSWFLFISCVV
jgi:short-subunit dehydrogenase involved in D-alanine esterification of teichoic acids